MTRRPKSRMLAPCECDDMLDCDDLPNKVQFTPDGSGLIRIYPGYVDLTDAAGDTATFTILDFVKLCKWWTEKQKVRR